MALPASSVFSPTPKCQIRLLENKPVQLHRWALLCKNMQLSPTFCMKIRNGHFGNRSKIKMQLSMGGERLWEAAPKPVKEFPWGKTGAVLLKRSLIIGQTTLKWSLITLFICSSLSDVIFSISRNLELLIPIGLLIGCLMTDFLKETLQEIFSNSEHKGLNMPLVVISCLFVIIKAASTVFAARTQVLLLHIANGGLMQVLWIWRNLLTENEQHKKDNCFTGPLATSAEEY
ncbi:uncharacterized protein [Euphorbia lathyris]|uniref:uncharacterized protein n=1 Tax=Euphorbia lathyris TaxID=212925 RepID=UPI0033131D8E